MSEDFWIGFSMGLIAGTILGMFVIIMNRYFVDRLYKKLHEKSQSLMNEEF